MRQIEYHIATTLDGFISHSDGGIEGFLMEGAHADEFFQSLSDYDTVLMGAKTYEFGFQYGLKAGEAAYPGLKHYIFSHSLCFEPSDSVQLVSGGAVEKINELKRLPGKRIWLCGGGELAACLFENGLIDKLSLKINPIMFGTGRPLFKDGRNQIRLKHLSSSAYDNGVVLSRYDVVNKSE